MVPSFLPFGDGTPWRARQLGGRPELVHAWLAQLDGPDPADQPAIGIASGTVIAGVLGARQVRLDHTVIGDPDNLAARLMVLAETVAKVRVLLCEPTVRAAPAGFQARPLPARMVKGKTREVRPYQWHG